MAMQLASAASRSVTDQTFAFRRYSDAKCTDPSTAGQAALPGRPANPAVEEYYKVISGTDSGGNGCLGRLLGDGDMGLDTQYPPIIGACGGGVLTQEYVFGSRCLGSYTEEADKDAYITFLQAVEGNGGVNIGNCVPADAIG